MLALKLQCHRGPKSGICGSNAVAAYNIKERCAGQPHCSQYIKEYVRRHSTSPDAQAWEKEARSSLADAGSIPTEHDEPYDTDHRAATPQAEKRDPTMSARTLPPVYGIQG
jgi:hypothetical protein